MPETPTPSLEMLISSNYGSQGKKTIGSETQFHSSQPDSTDISSSPSIDPQNTLLSHSTEASTEATTTKQPEIDNAPLPENPASPTDYSSIAEGWSLIIDNEIMSPDFDEPTLDDVYPEMAQKIDRLLADHLSDPELPVQQIKGLILDNYEAASLKPDFYWIQLAWIKSVCGVSFYNSKSLLSLETPAMTSLIDVIQPVADWQKSIGSEIEQSHLLHGSRQLANEIIRFTRPGQWSRSTVEEIVQYAQAHPRMLDVVVKGISSAVQSPENARSFIAFLDYYSQMADQKDNQIRAYQTRSDTLARYYKYHGFDAARKAGLEQNLFPLVTANDPEIAPLTRDGNSWPMHYGQFGITDYTIHCFVSPVRPQNLDELIHAYREIPTSDLAKFEQNRRDASTIQNTIIAGRDFIHDERPGVNDLLSKMLAFYQAKNNPDELPSRRQDLQNALDQRLASGDSGYYTWMNDGRAFNFDNYEKHVKNSFSGQDEQVSSILKRLVKNTTPDTLEKPATTDEGLNALINQLEVLAIGDEVVVSWAQLGELLTYINQDLLRRQQEHAVGLRPSLVKAISYAEKMATYAIRQIDAKNWLELPYDPVFKEIVKFRDLISSADDFSERDFEAFWQKFASLPMETAEDPSQTSQNYRLLAEHILKQLYQLAGKYGANQNTKFRVASLWSGNLNHELLYLTEYRRQVNLANHLRSQVN
jgi:hypothetical protein